MVAKAARDAKTELDAKKIELDKAVGHAKEER
jgi:hypothetical protein